MTMLTQARGPFGAAPFSTRTREAVDAAAKRGLATIKRFCIRAVAALLAGCAVAAIMALKVIHYLPASIHH